MCSLLVYTSTIDFYMFILYPAALLNSLILGVFHRVLYVGSHITDKQNSFISFILICKTLFPLLNKLARTLSPMLNKSGESRHHCLVLDLMEKAFSPSPLKIILSRAFWQTLFIKLRKLPSNSFFSKSFYHEYMLNFLKCFFYIS